MITVHLWLPPDAPPTLPVRSAPPDQLVAIDAALRLAVDEVMAHLRNGDVRGASDYMDEVRLKAGRWAHDEILSRIARRLNLPDWRTCPHWPQPR